MVVLAQNEVRALGHDHIGTEHLLLGLLVEEQGIAARVLRSLGVTVDDVRRSIGRGEPAAAAIAMLPFTPRAKKVLELTLHEAQALDHHYIGTEHLLLGLARENGGVAADILRGLGVDAERVRETTIGFLSG